MDAPDPIIDAAEEEVRLLAEIERLRAELDEAIRQIEYLHKKFGETGSGNAVLTRLREALK